MKLEDGADFDVDWENLGGKQWVCRTIEVEDGGIEDLDLYGNLNLYKRFNRSYIRSNRRGKR